MLRELALCAGVGMLSEGCRLAFEHLGVGFRTVCYVEREAFAAAQLVALMEAQCMDAAPIWDDLVTFCGRRWRGKVDCITAGFPCQPHSIAGKRKGLADERWIWPDIARIVGEVRPRFVLLENVPGLVTSGGLDACLGDLAALGYDAEWGLLSAAVVGASHERNRLFIFAWLADAGREHEHIQQWLQRSSEHSRGRDKLGDTSRDGRREGRAKLRGQPRRSDSAGASGSVGDAECARWTPTEPGPAQHSARQSESERLALADSRSARPQGRELSGARDDHRGGQKAHGSASELCGAFAPGPVDPRWSGIIADYPYLAPATEPGVRVLADGLAYLVDESRGNQLRAIGNGVVALCAAAAFVQLARRAGIMKQRDLFERGAA